MTDELTARRLGRRDFLKLGGWGALTLAAGGALAGAAKGHRSGKKLASASQAAGPTRALSSASVQLRLAATDGFISLPERRDNPLYMFGFVEAPLDVPANKLFDLKGQVQNPAPIIGVDENDDVYLTLTNIGLVLRPDLDDAHTVHWHGFRNQFTIFDGVPEVSISVPVGRDFPYFYRPREEGTYMYHCHFEDTEHVQLGMIGVIFVRPSQNAGSGAIPPGMYAYNDGDGSTAYDREFALLLDDIDTRPHDGLASIQEFVWSDYKPNYWLINGRSYPDTLKPNRGESGASGDLKFQPISSLIQANAGDRILLRFVDLGYEQHAMQVPGIPMKVIGEDASYLGPKGTGSAAYDQPNRADISYFTNTVYIGPGESRDVLFTAPAHSGGGGADVYLLRNRNYQKLTNGGAPGLGGMATEVRVYPPGTLPGQTKPNETYAV